MQKKLQERTNHVALGIDASGSMTGQPVVEVFDACLNGLKRTSIDFNQETRISIYTFGENSVVKCLVFDMDVMRFESMRGLWEANGQTPLRDCIGQVIEEHHEIPIRHGDHAFLLYFITDGEENYSRKYTVPHVQKLLSSVPDNWTLAGLVPNQRGRSLLRDLGFPQDAVSIWNVGEANAFEKVGSQFTAGMQNYMTARSTGAKKVNGLFQMDASGITKQTLRTQMRELPKSEYAIYNVYHDQRMDDLINAWSKGKYVKGCGYYQHTKKETIQHHKAILIQDIKTGKVYEGNRGQLGLPDATVVVNPADHPDLRIFVQSTADNRKNLAGNYALHRF